MSALEQFFAAPEAEIMALLLSCCGSHTWAREVVRWRDAVRDGAVPSVSQPGELMEEASRIWFGLDEADWLEAFACHPRIGEAKPPADSFLTHSAGEQRTAQETLTEVAARLVEGNRAYEAKFGFLYIVFASGRTAPELLAVLEQRLRNTRAEELQESARQQDRITRLRMERWLL